MVSLIWGGGYVAYRNPDSWLYIAGNLRTRKVFDFGILNGPEYIRADAVNTSTHSAYPFIEEYDVVTLDTAIELILESPFSHLFEIRK